MQSSKFLGLCSVLALSGLSLSAQTVSVLNPVLDDALRRAQLWGTAPLTSSLCIRPVHADRVLGFSDPFGQDSAYDFIRAVGTAHRLNLYAPEFRELASKVLKPVLAPTDSNWTLPTAWIPKKTKPFAIKLVPPNVKLQYNSHHDHGWQDGPMVPNRGAQIYASAGVYVRLAKFIEAQFAPEIVYAQNNPVPNGWNPPVRIPWADLPERFGTEPYQRSFPGQSYVRANIGWLSAGISSENVSWGPGNYTGIVQSNNAPGIPHLDIHTNRPIKTKIGSFEGMLLTGNLRYSGFRYQSGPSEWGASLPDVYRDPARDSLIRLYSSLVGVYNPRWFPGLSLGATRVIWTEGTIEPGSVPWTTYLRLAVSSPTGLWYQGAYDQMASLFARYVMPESHAEIFVEYGFDDARADFEDFFVSPGHSRAYLVGFRKLHEINGQKEYLDIGYQLTQIEAAKEVTIRRQYGWPVFYDSDYTNYGQNIGAGIGTGSNMVLFHVDHVKGKRRIGGFIEWLQRNNDNIYRGRTPWLWTWYGYDFTKKYTEVSFGLNYQEVKGPILYYVRAMGTQTYNWNNWYHPTQGYDPNIDTFRAPGNNVFGVNVYSGFTVLF
jgi:hypothetical protein